MENFPLDNNIVTKVTGKTSRHVSSPLFAVDWVDESDYLSLYYIIKEKDAADF
jgi:hypothetical protein